MAVLTVSSTANDGAGSLRQAIASAKAGDTIQFAPNLVGQTITLRSQLEISPGKNLTIDGANAAGLTISGNKTTRVFYVNSNQDFPTGLTVKNLIVTDAYTAERGGGILATHKGNVTVENVQFNNNVADKGGGAIYTEWETNLTVTNSKFDRNQATQGNDERGAGAIAFLSPGNFTIKNSEFTNNRGINGGAINSLNGKLTIENSRFINNDTTSAKFDTGKGNSFLRGYGGAVYTDRASSKNEASGTIQIKNSVFEGNRGRGEGGAAYLYTGTQDKVIIESSDFKKNAVLELPNGGNGGNGGGLVVLSNGLNKGLTIRDTAFTDNTAAGQGGGLWTMDSPTTITGSLFSDNKVLGTSYSNVGGAMALYSPTDIVDTKILNNSAGWVGGGITANDKFSVTVKDTVFYNNTADNGTNNWGIQQHTSRELTDKGSNIQWPPKRTSNANDYNATDQITLTQPTASDLNTDGIGASSSTGSTTPATPGSGTDPVTPDTGNPDPATPDAGSSDPLPGKPIPLVAVPDTITTKENTPVKINILANDTFSDKDSFTVTLVETAEKGNIRIDNNGTPNQLTDDFVLYTPKTNVTGADQFTYQIDKGDGNPVTATVKVFIAPESNSSPAPSPSPVLPAPLPSPSPTSDPAPSPSPAPIQVSPLPSLSLTPNPAPLPTPSPSFTPNPIPSPAPTPLPLPTPNPTPTPVSPLPAPTPNSTPDLASLSPTIPNRKPISTPAKPMRYEAENLCLTNYRTEWFEDSKASAERQISLRGTGKTSGSAEGVFKGKAGVYQVKIGYYDENDGQSSATVTVAGQSKRFKFDQDLFSDSAMHDARAVVTTHAAVTLRTGDRFKISAQLDEGEFARFDYIEFIPIPQRSPVSGRNTTNSQTQSRNADVLYGEEGNDLLKGGQGNDFLDGGQGNDILVGVEIKSSVPGRSERDVLIGGKGADRFQVGDESHIFYDDGKANSSGLGDYALLKDFKPAEGDRIHLHGKVDDYRIGAAPSQVGRGSGIYYMEAGQRELIAVVENQRSLNLRSNSFRFT